MLDKEFYYRYYFFIYQSMIQDDILTDKFDLVLIILELVNYILKKTILFKVKIFKKIYERLFWSKKAIKHNVLGKIRLISNKFIDFIFRNFKSMVRTSRSSYLLIKHKYKLEIF